ncbi:glycosyltransferase [Hyphobacterium sp.]|uniref:glycosyltransferase n=1 Tax=Hyphobacterium sp. TaxID=2004662 RepID=UPI003BAD8CD8
MIPEAINAHSKKIEIGGEKWTRIINKVHKLRPIAFVTVILLFPFFALISWLRIGFKKLLGYKPSIVWTPTPILNIAESSQLLQDMGYKSDTLVFTSYFITSKFTYNMKPTLENAAVNWWFTSVLFLWSMLKYDIYHFYYDGGLWSGMKIVPWARWLEAPMLRLAGKRIIVTAYGADVRTRKRNEMWRPWNLCVECPEPGTQCLCDDIEGMKSGKYHRDWCNRILAMGDMHDYIYGSDVAFAYWPIDVKSVPYVGAKPDPTRPVIIAHSPNHRHFKGTRFIQACIERLKEQGYNVELDIIEGLPNDVAKQRYAAADIIFAQCILGWPGFTEIEGMAAGKPVLTNVRNEPHYLSHVPGWTPISVTPDTMEGVLIDLLENPNKREELGRAGRKYVERYWSYEGCEQPYRELHEGVWKNGKFWSLISNKLKDLKRGDLRARPGRGLNRKDLAEFPVWTDPAYEIDRFEWGLYGLPVFDSSLNFRVKIPGDEIVHPAASAQMAMASWQMSLRETHIARHRERFDASAKWMASVVTPATETSAARLDGYKTPEIDAMYETPSRIVATRAMALPVFLRGERLGLEGMAEAADAMADALVRPIGQGGAWFKGNAGSCFADGHNARDPLRLACQVQAACALYEYALIRGRDDMIEKVREAVGDMVRRLKKYNPGQLIRNDRVGADFQMDDLYFAAAGLQSLGRALGNGKARATGKKLARGVRKLRLKMFVAFKAPI